ncbi:hypothetical protein BS50DRAFT_674729, partial [Corynespora cassiicola Philippines]
CHRSRRLKNLAAARLTTQIRCGDGICRSTWARLKLFGASWAELGTSPASSFRELYHLAWAFTIAIFVQIQRSIERKCFDSCKFLSRH